MNYNNPYNQYPYINNNYGYQQPTYQPTYQPQYQNQYQQPQQNYIPLTFVSGIEGAKAFIVAPNQVVFLKDSDSDLIFQKKADAQGKYEMKAFHMTEVNSDNNTVTNSSNYITKNDLNALESIFTNKIDILLREVEKLNIDKPRKGDVVNE